MKPISEWPYVVRFTGVVAVAGTVGLAMTNLQAFAESEWQPFALKYQLAAQNQTVVDALNRIQRNQAIERYNSLDFQLGQLATQQIMLSDAVKRDPEDVLKRQRLQEMDSDIAVKTKTYNRLKCQIEARDTGAACP